MLYKSYFESPLLSIPTGRNQCSERTVSKMVFTGNKFILTMSHILLLVWCLKPPVIWAMNWHLCWILSSRLQKAVREYKPELQAAPKQSIPATISDAHKAGRLLKPYQSKLENESQAIGAGTGHTVHRGQPGGYNRLYQTGLAVLKIGCLTAGF